MFWCLSPYNDFLEDVLMRYILCYKYLNIKFISDTSDICSIRVRVMCLCKGAGSWCRLPPLPIGALPVEQAKLTESCRRVCKDEMKMWLQHGVDIKVHSALVTCTNTLIYFYDNVNMFLNNFNECCELELNLQPLGGHVYCRFPVRQNCGWLWHDENCSTQFHISLKGIQNNL